MCVVVVVVFCCFFFFKQKTAYEMRISDWSSDVCSSDLSLDPASWHMVEKNILLQSLDHHWKEHLATLDALRQVVHLRAYAQKTPINEYKQEAERKSTRLNSSH